MLLEYSVRTSDSAPLEAFLSASSTELQLSSSSSSTHLAKQTPNHYTLPSVRMRVTAHGNRTLSNYFLLALEWEHFPPRFFCDLEHAHLSYVRIPNNAVSRLAEMVAMTMLANSLFIYLFFVDLGTL